MIGCNIGGVPANILAYADDMVLMAPSWTPLQYIIQVLVGCVDAIDMSCNVNKTVCMVFPPKVKSKFVASSFPCLRINNVELKFVDKFKYLGHIISNEQRDDEDVLREAVSYTHLTLPTILRV